MGLPALFTVTAKQPRLLNVAVHRPHRNETFSASIVCRKEGDSEQHLK